MLKPLREELVGLWTESLLTVTSAVWWTYLLWAHRNALYADLAPGLRGANLALVAVRGIAVLTLSLWLFQDL
ncbi:hypothetical protein ACFWP5_50060 [Streptomyces sp. NPDC058469]|uniref:hypothetical protein n=1 Tax=Streptomyces sp. NPDC058469 TaxID=3346514 RepID=UPI003653236C